MEIKKTARKHRSRVVSELLHEITPVEKAQTGAKMTLAARIDDLLAARGWSKSEFAGKLNKNPSEITKWLSGTQNFTIDTLAEIAVALNISVTDLFAAKPMQIVNKMHIVINVKQVQSPVFYYTPIEGKVFNRENLTMRTCDDRLTGSTSNFQA